jgi:transposase
LDHVRELLINSEKRAQPQKLGKSKEILQLMVFSNSRTRPKIVRAYNIELSLQKFWDSQNRKEATKYLKKWYFWANRSRLTPVNVVAYTIKKHREGILNYFDSKVTNWVLEGINGIVLLQKRNARGFKNVQ